jgi:uncharacterized protein YlxW (UPF0749 family)
VSLRDRPSQVALTVVTFVLGVLVVAQARAQATSSGLGALSAQDLTVLIANLNNRNDQLRVEVATLERTLGELQADEQSGDSSIDAIRADLARIRAWAGLEPVSGQGVRVTVEGPIDGQAVAYLLNELRNAGAEALAVDGVRVVPRVVVSGPADELRIDQRPLPETFAIEAIGGPETLTGSLTRIGGPVAQLAATYPEALLTVTPVDALALPATTRDLTPANGRPSL